MVPQAFGVDVAVCSEQRLQLSGSVGRGPPGQIARAAREIDAGERAVVVGECGRAVRQRHREVRAHPVEPGHEVVAQDGTPELTHRPHTLAIVRDEPVTRGTAELDVLVHGDALDHCEREPGRIDIPAQPLELLARPGRADGNVVQRADHAPDTGDLPDMRQRDGIAGTEPAERHVHWCTSRWTSSAVARPKSPGTASFRAPAATAKSSAAAGVCAPRSAAIRPAAKLSPPPTRSTTRITCRRLRASARVAASYSVALQACSRAPRISRCVIATTRLP